MIHGEEITIGTTKYIAPPLSLALVRAHKEVMKKAYSLAQGSTSEFDPNELLEMSEIVVENLKRNYPGITLKSIESDLDFWTLFSVFTKMLSACLQGAQKKKSWWQK